MEANHRPRKDHALQEWQVRRAQECAHIRAKAGMLKNIADDAGVTYKALAWNLRYGKGVRQGKVTKRIRERAMEIRAIRRATPTAEQLAREWNVDTSAVRKAAKGFTYKRLRRQAAEGVRT